jgi:hypothetical protein
MLSLKKKTLQIISKQVVAIEEGKIYQTKQDMKFILHYLPLATMGN